MASLAAECAIPHSSLLIPCFTPLTPHPSLLTWGHHDLMFLCSDAEEGQFIVGVQVPHCGLGLASQLVQQSSILHCGGIVHGRSDGDTWWMDVIVLHTHYCWLALRHESITQYRTVRECSPYTSCIAQQDVNSN